MPTLNPIVVNDEKKQVVTPYSKDDIIQIVNDAIESGQIVIEGGGGGSGGEQPTLFAPIITISGNMVSWVENTDNGGFVTSTIGTIDGSEVTNPFTITSDLDQKTLIVSTSAEFFKDGVSTKKLDYIGVNPVTNKIVLVVDQLRNYEADTGNNGFIQISITQEQAVTSLVLGKGKFVYNGVEYPIEQLASYGSNRSCAFHIPIVFQAGRQEIDFYLEILEDIELPQEASVGISISRYTHVTPLEAGYGTAGTWDTRDINGNVYGFLDDEATGTSYTTRCSIPTEDNVLKKGIYTAYFDLRKA